MTFMLISSRNVQLYTTYQMDNQFYIHLQSNESLNYFTANKPGNFTCMLPQTVLLEGRWYVGLTEFEYTHKVTKQPYPLHLLVHSDVCKDSIVGDKKCQLLRYIPFTKKSGQRFFERLGPVHYYLVNKQTIDRVEISINAPGYLIDQVLSDQPVRCTLHFTKAPPLVL